MEDLDGEGFLEIQQNVEMLKELEVQTVVPNFVVNFADSKRIKTYFKPLLNLVKSKE